MVRSPKVITKEKQLVLDDGPANRGAKLVPLQNRAWQGGSDLDSVPVDKIGIGLVLPCVCIQSGITKEFEDVPVKVVGA